VPDLVADTDCRPTIAGGGLHKDIAKWRVLENTAVHHRVVGDATRQSQIDDSSFLVQMIEHMKSDLLETHLQARCQIAITIGQRRLQSSRRSERPLELI
jgi:hypothetical protein